MKSRRLFVKLASVVLALAFIIGATIGCSATASPTPASVATTAPASATESVATATPAPAKSDVILTFTATGDNTWVFDVDQTIMNDFTAKTGIKIDVQKTPSDQYAAVLKAKFASGDGPDIAMVWPEANAAQFLPDQNFLDLSNEPWVANLSDAAKRNQSYNGKIIAWGSQGGDYGWGIIYSKDLFAKNNLSVPKNFNDFLNVCKTLKDSGVVPFYGTLKDQWSVGIWMANIGPLAEQQNPGLYDKLNSNTAKFADVQVFKDFINEYKQLYDNGYLGKDPLSGDVNGGLTALSKGETAMTLVNCTPDGWFSSIGLTVDMPKYAMFPAPFANNVTMSSYDGSLIRVINKNSKHIDEAKAYFSFISQSDELTKYYSDPARTSIAPSFTEFLNKFTWPDSTKSLIANSDGKTFTIMETGIKYWDNTAVGKAIEQAILGEITPDQALQSLDSDRDKLFAAASGK